MSRRGGRQQWLTGLNTVSEGLRAHPELALELWVAAERHDARVQALMDAAKANGVAVQSAPRQRLERLVEGASGQGVVLKRRSLPQPSLESILERIKDRADGLVLVLDGVVDPHNLGACLRTAAAAGVSAALIGRNRGAPITPTVRRVASGALERLAVPEVSNLHRSLGQLAAAGFQVVGLDAVRGNDLFGCDLRGPVAIVAGAEHRGLRRLTRESCSVLAAIPMAGEMESLNVSVAVGVALYAARSANLQT